MEERRPQKMEEELLDREKQAWEAEQTAKAQHKRQQEEDARVKAEEIQQARLAKARQDAEILRAEEEARAMFSPNGSPVKDTDCPAVQDTKSSKVEAEKMQVGSVKQASTKGLPPPLKRAPGIGLPAKKAQDISLPVKKAQTPRGVREDNRMAISAMPLMTPRGTTSKVKKSTLDEELYHANEQAVELIKRSCVHDPKLREIYGDIESMGDEWTPRQSAAWARAFQPVNAKGRLESKAANARMNQKQRLVELARSEPLSAVREMQKRIATMNCEELLQVLRTNIVPVLNISSMSKLRLVKDLSNLSAAPTHAGIDQVCTTIIEILN